MKIFTLIALMMVAAQANAKILVNCDKMEEGEVTQIKILEQGPQLTLIVLRESGARDSNSLSRSEFNSNRVVVKWGGLSPGKGLLVKDSSGDWSYKAPGEPASKCD